MDDVAIREWRKATRAELIARRMAIGDEEHARHSQAIENHLRSVLDELRFDTLAFCWPYQREFDARPLVTELIDKGATCALPVVVGRGQPLSFRQWDPETQMRNDVFGIPVPVDSREIVPEVILLPVNGFDARGFRLGYGAGYFDITLAKLGAAAISIGIGFEVGRLATIYPQVHDMPLDFTITERGVMKRKLP